MRVSSIRLKNFKRFTDLIVHDIPQAAKLVVVVGPNGCGKSSLFDAFLQWYRTNVGFGHDGDQAYFRKDEQGAFDWANNVVVELHDNAQPRRGTLYLRTAHRNDPDFSVTGFSRPNVPSETMRFQKLIENDQTVSDNYQRLVYDTTAAVYDSANNTKTVETLREELIGKVRASMKRVFGDLLLNNITDPLGAGAFFFEKGTAKSYHYKNLSGGEKAAFDLLLDLHIKKKFFDEAIYCVDEVETHLHTRVQGALVREMVDILPANAQLWVTTHSLGVLRAAQQMLAAAPESVCIIDFDGVDPDIPHELVPSSLGRLSWEKMLSIALDDLSPQIAPNVVVLCEGSAIGNRRKDFDAEIYNRVLGAHSPGIVFISGGASHEILASGESVRAALGKILPSTNLVSLCDRDDKSPQEVIEWESKGGIVLSERNLETFLFADEVIAALAERENKSPLLPEALQIKTEAINNSVNRGNPRDDLKSAAGEIFGKLKSLLNLQRAGNNVDAFMRDTLAPLIVPEMSTYQSMKAAVIDRIPR